MLVADRKEMLETADPEWEATLGRLAHDSYHRPGYVELTARQARAHGVAIRVGTAGDELLLPLLIREIPGSGGLAGALDATSPYGYPGPLYSPGQSPERRHTLWSELVDVAANQGLVSLFVRCHPILTPGIDHALPATTVVTHGRTVFVDLREDLDRIVEQRREDTRRDLSSLRETGFTALVDDWSRYGDFKVIYRGTMERVGADDFYFFDTAYFRDLRTALGPQLHLVTVLAPDGATAAGGLFMERQGILQYHLGGTAGEYRKRAPAKLMFDRMIEWGRDRGATHLHLGGGLGGKEDSIFHFKKGWSGHTATFFTLRVVPDEESYRLILSAGEEESEDRTGFFPAYRRGRS